MGDGIENEDSQIQLYTNVLMFEKVSGLRYSSSLQNGSLHLESINL